MALARGVRLGPYEILALLGSGGMGEVYRARDDRLGREVAVKVLHADSATDQTRLLRFEQEAKAAGALNHPNLVSVFDTGREEGTPYVVFELLEGATLRALLDQRPLPASTALDYAVQIAQGLAAAHEKGIVHRDLKPENLFVTVEGRVKVLDFGLAKLRPARDSDALRSDVATASAITGAGTVLGTVNYMSPEQVEGHRVDHRSDIFSFGSVLHEMLSGARAFRRGTAAETMTAILKDDPPHLSEVQPDVAAALDRIARRCLRKRPEERFQSARDLAFALEATSESRRDLAGPASRARTSIAVLPFTDLSPERDQAYFCEGIAEEILSVLALFKGLRVSSRLSTFGVAAPSGESLGVARRLGVDSLLEGSVRKAGEQLRIAARLVSVADGSVLWSERYDRELKDVFAVQGEIGESIGRVLRVATDWQEGRRLQLPPTSRIEAYEFYLRGRQHFYRATRFDLEAARQMFSRAIQIDPAYARAYAGLADTCSFLYQPFLRDPAVLEEADEASRKALALEPGSGEAHTSRGVVLWLQERPEEAEQEFEAAIRLEPALFEPHYLYGMCCHNLGRPERAAREFERAFELQPDDYQSPLILGSVYRGLGQAEKAQAAFRRGLTLAERRLELQPDDARARYLGAGALVALGETEHGLEWGRAALALAPQNTMTLYNLAGVFAAAGRLEEGLDHLSAAVQGGFVYRRALENDPDFAPLRTHPRFQAIVGSLR